MASKQYRAVRYIIEAGKSASQEKGTIGYGYEEGCMKVRTEARRTAILQAAAELFQEKGYERASINELVRRCGGSKQTVYGYFPSKEALFMAVVQEVATGHLPEAVEEIRGRDGAHADLEE